MFVDALRGTLGAAGGRGAARDGHRCEQEEVATPHPAHPTTWQAACFAPTPTCPARPSRSTSRPPAREPSSPRLGVAQRLLSRPAVLHLHNTPAAEGEHLVKGVGSRRWQLGGIPAALDHHRATNLNDLRQAHPTL